MSAALRDAKTGRFAPTPKPPTAKQMAELLAEVAEIRGLTEFANQTRQLVASPHFTHWFGA